MGLHFAEMQALLVSLHQAPTPASDSQAQKDKGSPRPTNTLHLRPGRTKAQTTYDQR
ncbi:hypothetical protein [Alloprevotella tannerae]|uniref:hypothetical protein n=1 Tax=Alloprevotella tannerae TaxID=76122 RepID=UPI00261B4F3D|nr:hypothetical protein [Alloprevotella tannerae]